MRAHEQLPGLVALGYPGPDAHGGGGDGGDDDDLSFRGRVARVRHALSAATAAQVAACVVDGLKPELLRRGGRGPAGNKPLGPTAWLDGLRGWAAFTVCFVHLAVYTHSRIELCYGAALDDDGARRNTTPAAWPFLRLFWSGGHFAVMTFFVISGYVLPGRLLALLHDGRRADFVDALNSAVFRRALRLFLPVVWSTLALATIWHLTGVVTPWPARQPTYLAELWTWLLETLKFVYFYRSKVLFTYYNIHTWTIPVELRGSMLIFVWLFVWHAFSQRLRIVATLAMTLYLLVGAAGAWYACFMAGMLTVELDMLAASEKPRFALPWDGALRALQRRPLLRTALLHLMLLAALWLGSEPSSDEAGKDQVLGTCPGWKTLSNLIPPAYTAYDEPDSVHRWFWLFWAAWLLLVSVKEIPWARALFEMRFSQYLGKHSFALYLIHGPSIGMFSERLFYLTGVKKGPLSDDDIARYGHLYNKWHDSGWWIFSNDGPFGLEPNFLFCVAVSLPVFLYVAELGTRMFDEPSVRVSRWAYNRLKRTAR